MQKLLFLLFCSVCSLAAESSIVTPGRLIEYFQANGVIDQTARVPETVIFCYGPSFDHCLHHLGPFEEKTPLKRLYVFKDKSVGVTGGFGIGSPALAMQMEKLLALGVRRCILVGNAGALSKELSIGEHVVCARALKADDALSCLYVPGKRGFVDADQELLERWEKISGAPRVSTWTFSSLFFETPRRIRKARRLGCSVVEMEVATFYALARAKQVRALALFIVSDHVTEKGWTPGFREKALLDSYAPLCERIALFCEQ